MKRSAAELKKLSRGMLLGKYSTFIGTFVLLGVISSAASLTLFFFPLRNSWNRLFLHLLVSILISLITSVFSAGLLKQALNATRRQPLSVKELIYGFQHHPDRILIVQLLITAISTICNIPGLVALLYVPDPDVNPWSGLIISYLLMILGSCVTFVLTISFSQAVFLLLDNHQISAATAIRTSIQLMRGNKARYFRLHLSFIGLILLASFSLGIGFLWLQPYINVTNALFYQDITGKLDSTQQSA